MPAGRHNGAATCWDEQAGGSATAVRPTVEAGEDRVIRETCWTRLVKVTERATVMVTEREKLIGVTETCTARHVETTETTETREMGTVEKRLPDKDGVKEDEHTQR